MVFVRPVTIEDLDPLLALAGIAGVGLTTLPRDRDLLRKRILKSQRSMENIPDRPGGESYLFVMEDAASGSVVGASGVVSKVGGFEPCYAYRIERQIQECTLLSVRKEIPVLHLVREHDGPAEIGSLFLSPDYRGRDYGRLLQLVRFVFIARHREAFETQVVSELRGSIDENGRSAFWEAIGKHFFEIDFPRADYLSVVNKKFIADLMPKYPIYVPLLPADAQAVIGRAHDQGQQAMKTLQGEGFTFNGMVDIFDGGPCIACQRDDIRTVRQSRIAPVAGIVDLPAARATHIVARADGVFRACADVIEQADNAVRIGRECASVLHVGEGDSVIYAPLRPEGSVGVRGEGERVA